MGTRTRLPDGRAAELARGLNLTRQQVWRLRKRGMPETLPEAKEWIRQNHAPATGEGKAISQTARLKRLQGDREEMEVRKLRDELIEREAVKEWGARLAQVVRFGLRSIPARVAETVAGLNDEAEVQRHVGIEVDRVLAEMAEVLRGLPRIDGSVGGGPDEAAAGADAGPVG